jgi:hypothetical protein
MQFNLLATITLPLQTQLQWLFYSNQTSSFITGDDRKAFALPVSNPRNPSALIPSRPYDDRIPPQHPCNLPIPASLYEELATASWHGFHFLAPAAYDLATEGDLLRTLIFGPNYSHYLHHPSSNLILSLRSAGMELLEQSSAGFKSLSKTRTRGSATLAFAAHPSETLIVYGDNAGNFHAHKFDSTAFGKASKIAAKQRKASRVEFTQDGQRLFIGGMGYLASYSYSGGKFTSLHDVSIPVADFCLAKDGNLILVNQGLHGVCAYQYDSNGFVKISALETPGATPQISLSICSGYLTVLTQDSASCNLYEIMP